MFDYEINKLVEASEKKVGYMKRSPLGYLLISMLAGAYVGFGIILIFAIGGPIAEAGGGAYLKLIMGASFGVALSLVIFAGSELFTGNNMVSVVGALCGKTRIESVAKLFLLCYIGNLLGSVFLALLVAHGGSLAASSHDLILKVAAIKMSAGAKELFIRGILCNWLVCLAVWMSGRTQNDAAKLILIFWCLFAFIASGFEHCVANMTLLSLALILPHGADIAFSGLAHNLVWVTLGNIVGGAVFVGGVYWFASAKSSKSLSTATQPRVVPLESE